MTEQTQTFVSVDDTVAKAAEMFIAADVGRYNAVLLNVIAATMLAKERNAEGRPMSADWCGARIADKFEGALAASGFISLKTAKNYASTVQKAVRFALEGFAQSGGLYTMDYDTAIVSATFEALDGFKPNMRDLSAALSLATNTAKPRKAKATATADNDVTAQAADANETAKASEKCANAVKVLSALIQDADNYSLFLSEEMGELVTAILKVRREQAEQPQETAQAA